MLISWIPSEKNLADGPSRGKEIHQDHPLHFIETQLLDEAEGLRKGNDALRQTAEQQEFVEMATMELLVKTEDMEAVEQDLMCMPTLPTEELFLKKRDFCLQILRQLRSFLDHLTAQLSRQRFNTGRQRFNTKPRHSWCFETNKKSCDFPNVASEGGSVRQESRDTYFPSLATSSRPHRFLCIV